MSPCADLCTFVQDRYAEAEAMLRPVIAAQQIVLGPGGPTPAANCCLCLQPMCAAQSSLQLLLCRRSPRHHCSYDHTVQVPDAPGGSPSARCLPPSTPATAALVLIAACCVQGKHAEAEILLRQLMDVQQRALGPGPHTACHAPVCTACIKLSLPRALQGEMAMS